MKFVKGFFIILLCVFLLNISGCNKKSNKEIDNNENGTKQVLKKEVSKEPNKIMEKQSKPNKPTIIKKNTTPVHKLKEIFPKNAPLKYNNEGVCIFMYHSIAYEKNNGLRMPKEKFEEQMKYIKDQGYTTLTLTQLYDFLQNNKPIPRKSVVITLDDGYADNYTTAYPILKKYGINATIFVVTDNIDKNKDYMTSEQLKELDRNGIDIQSHTTNHEELQMYPYEMQLKNLRDSKIMLEKLLNKKVNCIAYPCGKYNKDTIIAAKDAGYTLGFATGGRFGNKKQGIYSIKRIGVYSDNGMNTVKGNLSIE
ncbi:polysaccharide deacetylase family protein [Hathewaya limosa]|uniref:Peptidoglycan/xylan/chitin deacetylase (PgdA/CDA1 family) n=1 Tax=Hathewaya limosa TaxID=1536 RepID=A0ABU0JTR8_HATLI|nr:polysaccharide deacetylase family protein [Hathewaya limosa]MDQ0480501.1 peptidoglycan/xylan/chitin deacetylase (PgdA/CDA1 family) [Hathewaya limosa]